MCGPEAVRVRLEIQTQCRCQLELGVVHLEARFEVERQPMF